MVRVTRDWWQRTRGGGGGGVLGNQGLGLGSWHGPDTFEDKTRSFPVPDFLRTIPY